MAFIQYTYIDTPPLLTDLLNFSYGGQEWSGHGVGVANSPAIYSNVHLSARHDAQDALMNERYRLEAKASSEWASDADDLGLHRWNDQHHRAVQQSSPILSF